ncbi:hypothetical protein [Paenimyroides viscosum]|uniref:DUF4468 domain-containing protein n=1 Tax=Paenimyroides viscosum TaxID=2488729 RepID=A0A3P1B312_9FLAO|nr:hypothetical protein [Paenimyroides viscosum]RRA94973.1 hypothetical protein EG242_07180 [Paenimyroides viscosum]
MNIKKYILSFFILLSTMVFGQDMIADSLEINRFDHLVNEIKNDSSLKMISLDDVKLLNRFNKKTYHSLSVQLKNDKIVCIDLFDYSEITSTNDLITKLIRTKYFINNENVLIYTEEYYGHTRNKLYYKNADIIKAVNNDFVINSEDELNYAIKNKEQIYKNFKKIYKVSKRKIKKLQNEQL